MHDSQSQPTPVPALYQHVKRPDWGVAILAWERDGKRAYQFEDGEMRVFKKGYYKLMQEVDRPANEAAALIASLDRDAARSETERGSERALIPFEIQVALFERDFPNGFRGERWRGHRRGEGVARRLKRHRDAAIREAQTLLARDELDRLLAAEDYGEVQGRVLKILESTDLVPPTQLKRLADRGPDLARQLAEAVRHLLHGDGELAARFDMYAGVLAMCLGKTPSWRLATAIPALVFPTKHLCVRATLCREQARWMAPRLEIEKRPTGATYQRIDDMARRIDEQLREAGRVPQDLLDIHDFMAHTLRPSARDHLEALRLKHAASGNQTTPSA